MTLSPKTTDFFVAGGALRPNAPSYVERPADDELFELACAGEFAYVLTARQMGKSSLMHRTARRLKKEGIRAVRIDLTNIGTVSVEKWYLGLLAELSHQLRLRIDLETWWHKRSWLGTVQRFTIFLRDIVLSEIQQPVVIFIDEIDFTLNLGFSDGFFAATRSLYNARAQDSTFERLTFVLLGVASPADLIKDRTKTPFNIGQSVLLQDFSRHDAATLQAGLEKEYSEQGEAIFTRIYDWTDGHPYLTQKLCQEVVKGEEENWTNKQIDELVEETFLLEKSLKDDNLKFVQDKILTHHRTLQLLEIYEKIYLYQEIRDDAQSQLQNQLKLSGLIKVDNAFLQIRNKIYHSVFNLQWIKENSKRVKEIIFSDQIVKMLLALPPDVDNEQILISEFSDRQQTVDVEQTASWKMEITNGGQLVSRFHVYIAGVPEDWITISQPQNLSPGSSSSITISMTPSRSPSSSAGDHHFAIIVSSPDYPNHSSQRGITLTINPYYEFKVEELQPPQLSIGGNLLLPDNQSTVYTELKVTNKGNKKTKFYIEGTDPEKKCRIIFEDKTTNSREPNEIEIEIRAGMPETVPITITPTKRSLLWFKETYDPITVKTTNAGNQQARTQLERLLVYPKIPRLLFIIFVLLFLALLAYLLRPKVITLGVSEENIRGGEEVMLSWDTSFATNLRVEADDNSGSTIPYKVEGAESSVSFNPYENTRYRLIAKNPLSNFPLIGGWFTADDFVTVKVDSYLPKILSFEPQKTELLTGEKSIISWHVVDMSGVSLHINNGASVIEETQFNGQYEHEAGIGETVYTLIARNRYGEVPSDVKVSVREPTAPTLMSPEVATFLAEPSQLILGEVAVLSWSVPGATLVKISNMPDKFPAKGQIPIFPEQTTTYLLSASNGESEIFSAPQQIVVVPPPPTSTVTPIRTPTLQPPVIKFFDIDPPEQNLILGNQVEFRLFWRVTGGTTKIEISSPDLGTFSGFSEEDSIPITPEESTFYILTAFNGEASVSQKVEIRVLQPTAIP